MSNRNRDEIEAWLVKRIAGLLSLDVTAIERAAPFNRYGLESIDAIGLSGELEEFLGRKLPANLLWEHPSIAEVSSYLCADEGESR